MQQAGIIVPPDINQSSYTFRPDAENPTRFIFGLSGILNVGEDVIKATLRKIVLMLLRKIISIK